MAIRRKRTSASAITAQAIPSHSQDSERTLVAGHVLTRESERVTRLKGGCCCCCTPFWVAASALLGICGLEIVREERERID
jgi:hypothetical protein